MTVQWRCRGDGDPARYGITVTKRTAKKAVERNRIRRRLREAVQRTIGADRANTYWGYDIVLVGRRTAMTMAFDDLVSALSAELARIMPCKCGPNEKKGD